MSDVNKKENDMILKASDLFLFFIDIQQLL